MEPHMYFEELTSEYFATFHSSIHHNCLPKNTSFKSVPPQAP